VSLKRGPKIDDPIPLGELLPQDLAAEVQHEIGSGSASLIVYSASRSTMGDRVFRYITLCSREHLPILTALLVAGAEFAKSLKT
jgi:hypothetical protein